MERRHFGEGREAGSQNLEVKSRTDAGLGGNDVEVVGPTPKIEAPDSLRADSGLRRWRGAKNARDE